MLDKRISAQDALFLLDKESKDDLVEAVARAELKCEADTCDEESFRVGDIVVYKLARVMQGLGVDREKAFVYADAVLGARLPAHRGHLLDWIENETQELFCLIADNELARIFLRDKEDLKETDVGAVKPVLFPTTKCEVNVFRVIRPVLYKARRLLRENGTAA